MSSQITHTTYTLWPPPHIYQMSTYTPDVNICKHRRCQHIPLGPILDICDLIFNKCTIFYSLSQPHHVTVSHPSPGDNHRSTGMPSERTQGQAKIAAWNSFSYICTMALHSFRSFAHWRAASIIPLLPKATFTPSIQPNLGLPSQLKIVDVA